MKYLAVFLLLSALGAADGFSQQSSTLRLPAVIHECDIARQYNIKACTDWTIAGVGQYTGPGANGSTATLTVEHFDRTSLSIHRQDSPVANAPALEGDYEGTIQDGQLIGKFFIFGAFSGMWTGTFEGTASARDSNLPELGLPAVIHECDIVEQYKIRACTDWTIAGPGRYTGQGAEGFTANLTVKRFDRTFLLIHREDASASNLPNLTVEYVGRIQDGRVNGTFTLFKTYADPISGVWQATLDGTASPENAHPLPQVVPQHNLIIKTHGPDGHVPPVTDYGDGPAEIACMYARAANGPAKCHVVGPGLAASMTSNDGAIYTSGPGAVTLTCEGVGEVSCSIRVRTPVTKP